MLRPCRLELNNTGAWKLLGRFDGTPSAAADRVLNAAAELADALNDRATGRWSMCALRVSTDETVPVVLMRHRGDGEGWRPCAEEEGAPAA